MRPTMMCGLSPFFVLRAMAPQSNAIPPAAAWDMMNASVKLHRKDIMSD